RPQHEAALVERAAPLALLHLVVTEEVAPLLYGVLGEEGGGGHVRDALEGRPETHLVDERDLAVAAEVGLLDGEPVVSADVAGEEAGFLLPVEEAVLLHLLVHVEGNHAVAAAGLALESFHQHSGRPG